MTPLPESNEFEDDYTAKIETVQFCSNMVTQMNKGGRKSHRRAAKWLTRTLNQALAKEAALAASGPRVRKPRQPRQPRQGVKGSGEGR